MALQCDTFVPKAKRRGASRGTSTTCSSPRSTWNAARPTPSSSKEVRHRRCTELYSVSPSFFFRFAGRTGNDPTNSARYHPLYITDSSEGGFGQKTENEQRQQNVYAGVAYDSKQFPYPTSGESTTSTRTQSKSNPPIVSSKISHWKMGLCSPLRSTGVQEWPLIEGYRFFWLPASISFSFNSWTFVRVDGQDDGQMGRIGHI